MICCVLGAVVMSTLVRPIRRLLGSERRFNKAAESAVGWRPTT